MTERVAAGDAVDPAELRISFQHAADLPERMERLTDLEAQALSVVDDEPLKLGSIGSAILDTYVGSLTGHYVLARFYEYVSNPKADYHEDWVARITASMADAGDGTREQPLPAVTPAEARVYARLQDWEPVGSIYQSDQPGDNEETVVFSLLLQVRPDSGPLKNVRFDLSGLYEAMRQEFQGCPC